MEREREGRRMKIYKQLLSRIGVDTLVFPTDQIWPTACLFLYELRMLFFPTFLMVKNIKRIIFCDK